MFDIIFFFLTSLIFIYYYIKSLFGSVNYKYEKTGGEIVSKVLKTHGIKNIFTLTGGHISPILVGCENLDINVIDVRNEATAVFAADAVSRLSKDNQVGVAIVTAGPGVTNCITALRNGEMAESGFILIGGSSPLLLKGRGSLQDVEQMELLKNVCKKTYNCSRVKDIANTVNQAIISAKSDVPGPVFIELPIDILYSIQDILKNSGASKSSKSIWGKLVKFYINIKIAYYFSDNSAPISYNSLQKKSNNSLPKELPSKNLKQIGNAIKNSYRPILLLGSQVLNIDRNNIENMVNYIKKLDIPVYFSGSTRGMLGKHKWYLEYRHKKRQALKDADLIILLGVSCDFRLDYGRTLNKKAKVISINENKNSLKLNKNVFWNGTTINMKPYDFLKNLYEKAIFANSSNDWTRILKSREEKREKEIKTLAEISPNDKFLNPIKVCKEISKLIDEKTIIIMDGGDFVGTAAYVMRPQGYLKWLDPGPFGTLGVGAGFALGAKLCYPDYQVIIIWGDGASGYSIVEYDTFKRHNIPILGVIGNDACWTQIKRDQVKILKSEVACNLDYSNYEKIGECFGVSGTCIDNIDKLEDSIKNYEENFKNNKSYIMNIKIGKSDFREGSISV